MTDNHLLLEVKDLQTHFFTDEGVVKAVNGVDFTLRRGVTLGVVGESGCGKSVTAFSILQLVNKPGRIVDGHILYHRNGSPGNALDLAALDRFGDDMRGIRGNEIAMIFQEPMNSLSPVHKVGHQIVEAIRLHRSISKQEAKEEAVHLLDLVGIPRPAERFDAYTFQLSGGMRQRVMIAMALACSPQLLIADEPTTALDVTTQAQILELMKKLQAEMGMSIMLITHDLGVVAEMCDEVVVMYLGEVVEQATVDQLFHDPQHPYTRSLLRSLPRLGYGRRQKLAPILGSIPDPYNRPSGCPFHPRCTERIDGRCEVTRPAATTLPDGRHVRCLLYEDVHDV